MDPLTLGAAELAAAIRKREITVAAVVEAHIERIRRVNPMINAVVTPTFESARTEAADADRRITDEGTAGLPALFGVPVTIKDCWGVEGVRFTGGSWFRRDEIAGADAEVVSRLRRAGAIILGKTNLPDMCWGFESVNPVFGRTRNPRSLDHSAGGSSGGEAAIIAAGGSPLGVGSDIGGSLRNPAAINGCVSLKPSPGRVPVDDHLPRTGGAIEGWNVGGPLARRVEDLALALEVMEDGPPLMQPEIGGVGCVTFLARGPLRPRREVAETVLIAAGALEAGGMVVSRDDSLPIDRLGFLYTNLLRKHTITEVKEQLGGGRRYSTIRELIRGARGKPRIAREALMVESYIRFGGLLGSVTGDDSFEKLDEYKAMIDETIGEGVLLLPLLLTRPPKHGATYLPQTQIPFATPFNATRMPAAIVPVRWTGNGLPLSVQIVGREGADELVLAVASELERVFGGWHVAEPGPAGEPG